MHTLILTLIGLLLLWISYLISSRHKIRFLRYYPISWVVFCFFHLLKELHAGNPIEDELLAHSIVLGIPLIGWFCLTQYLRRKNYSL